ncbi:MULTISPECIES: PHP domain-containing protein [Enterococcus]|uniref:Histidinol-phosphatase n=1 Tax=Candidatus Enterococcus ferrettii TaxID=2815324 RepID=A0ABV0EUZ9_9ENTE|nr:PHP domain-containing protein [Enterococcus sp. 665A]MBO1339332.1 histidinol phosphate phosphatase [Enterococcus sp. 665A]
MQYYDQHLHTYFSFDSEEQFESYLAYQPEFFVSTDHFDLSNPSTGKNDIPDYSAYVKKLEQLKASSATKFLRGIEIGVVPGQEDQIIAYLNQHPHDLKLISIHQNGRFDYMDDVVLTKDPIQTTHEYFDQMLKVLMQFPEGDILTHFDYGLRRFTFTPEELAEHFETQLIAIFKKVVERELAMELNAKSFLKYGNEDLYRYAVPLYQSVGGKLFTLGSDAHVAEDYQLGFKEMGQLLTDCQVENLLVVQGKERYLTPLPIL